MVFDSVIHFEYLCSAFSRKLIRAALNNGTAEKSSLNGRKELVT